MARGIDIRLKEEFGIDTLVLMENAGRAVAQETLRCLKRKPKKICIFCGKGNNGGDGFVAARHLLAQGLKPDIFLADKISRLKYEARLNMGILKKLNQKIIEVSSENLFMVKDSISKGALIIDALLGVGLRGEPEGIYRDVIAAINASGAYIISVDIPSGLDATTGRALGCCVQADRTVTFMALKRGMVLRDGPKACGKIVVRDLGIPLWRR
jgi:hydroxyethylthiazole kinase-like uncharacterized protein yjeF